MNDSVYGSLNVHIADDQTDRIGIRTLILKQRWVPGGNLKSVVEVIAQEPGVPAAPAGLLFIGRQTRRDGGGLITFWTFEGVDGNGKGPTVKDRNTSLDSSFEGGFSEVSLAKHRRWAEFHAKYGVDILDGQIVTADVIPRTTSTGLVKASTAADPGEENPLFGETKFFRIEGTYSHRYVTQSTAAAMSRVEKIHSAGSLPGRAEPSIAGGRNWLKVTPIIKCRGLFFEVIESYWLSGEGGWNDVIYGDGGRDRADIGSTAPDSPNNGLVADAAGAGEGAIAGATAGASGVYGAGASFGARDAISLGLSLNPLTSLGMYLLK